MQRALTIRHLLALAMALSAGMHAALVPEHLTEMPALGYSFIVAAVVGVALSVAVMAFPSRFWIPRLAALFLAFEIIAWVAFVSAPVPGFDGTPEPVEAIAVVCKAAELVGLGLALPLAWAARPQQA